MKVIIKMVSTFSIILKLFIWDKKKDKAKRLQLQSPKTSGKKKKTKIGLKTAKAATVSEKSVGFRK